MEQRAFQGTLADLGIARAAAGLLRNPVLTLLLPWGPKQLEATARLPIDAIWQRPRRVAAARAAVTAVTERLVAGALLLVAQTRLGFVDVVIASRRVTLANENLQLGQRMADLTRRRFEAGDISQLEADITATEAARARQDADRAALDLEIARIRPRHRGEYGHLLDGRRGHPACAALHRSRSGRDGVGRREPHRLREEHTGARRLRRLGAAQTVVCRHGGHSGRLRA